MINKLIALFQSPERGWDPVPEQHVINYGGYEWQYFDDAVIDSLAASIGGFEGKKILDLGGGPGQYSVAFAKRGAQVTWHDISQRYQKMASDKAIEHQVSDKIRFSLGYLDDVEKQLGAGQFDLVFNRICWSYSFTDKSFAKVIYNMIAPGGYGYIVIVNSDSEWEGLSTFGKFRTWLNANFSIKIGHPYPPRGRGAKLFLDFPLKNLSVDYSFSENDKILLQK